MRTRLRDCFLVACLVGAGIADAQSLTELGLYRTFERSVENNNNYANKFVDVNLACSFTSPTGVQTDFIGFYDGDGNGAGDKQTGNVWKIRFMPDELGEWNYSWSWSDSTPGGAGTFSCVASNAGKGVLRAYEDNPRWFAYNGTEPVFLKSYYESGFGSLAQPFDWIATNVYQTYIDNGYNHLQVNWLFPLCCFHEYYHDGPPRSTDDLTLYQNGMASSTMRLDVWRMLERHVSWLNDRDVGLHMFLGFEGGRNGGPAWTSLSAYEKDFYVKYVVARLAPYANIAGWNFVWEVPGDRLTHELGWVRLVEQYDVFNHLRTYHDEAPLSNQYDRPEYTYAAVENHYMFSSSRDADRPHWKSGWTHHEASLAGYVTGKPVIMTEGNALWRRYWVAAGVGATRDDLRQAAWGCTTAAASFVWCGHVGGGALTAFGPDGLPFFGDINEYAASAFEIDILAHVMNNEVVFHRMVPSDNLLSDHDSWSVWCLAEPGDQYLVFSKQGSPFVLQLQSGVYNIHKWINTKTGDSVVLSPLVTDGSALEFTPPNGSTDWVLLVRSGPSSPREPLLGIRKDGATLKLELTAEVGISNTVQTATALGGWTNWTNVVGNGAMQLLPLNDLTNESTRFFRAFAQ